MYKKILLAIDGSPSSREAAKHAVELAKAAKGKIVAVNVLYSALRFPKSREEVIEEQRKDAGNIFREVKEIAGKKIKLHTKILEGPPWVKIVEEAEEGKYDIIIMGSKGRGALGSVAEKVVRDARCPVLVCKV
ncbi:MAG: universal stress protein [Euryarchaeota archaeon]|nr:universal stress protein [Euryarchaeota archaeon]